MAAIEKLQPQQKELLIHVYWNRELQKDIAAEKGVSEMTISRQKKKLRIFEKNIKIMRYQVDFRGLYIESQILLS